MVDGGWSYHATVVSMYARYCALAYCDGDHFSSSSSSTVCDYGSQICGYGKVWKKHPNA